MKNRTNGTVKHKVNVIKNPNTWIIGAIFLVLFALHYDQIVPILSQINILTVFGRKAHSLQRTLFIIPIAYVGYVFGLRAGIAALVVVYLGILPRVFFLSENPNDEFWEATLAMGVALVFNLWLETRRKDLAHEKHLMSERLEKLAERHKAEQALSKLASIVNSTDDAIIGFGLGGLVTSINSGAQTIFHCREQELLGEHISRIIPAYTHERLEKILHAIRNGEHEHRSESLKQGNDTVDLWVTISPVKDEQGNISSASLIAKDITEQKNLEREILEISKREQEKLGELLHDSLGQHLTGIAFKCKVLEKKLTKKRVKNITEPMEIALLINQAINQTRSLSKGLLHFEIEAIGMVNALSELIRATEDLYGIKASFYCDEVTKVHDNTVAAQLYLITQEAINNAVRHGKPSVIEVGFETNDNTLRLTISDNGGGTLPQMDRNKGLGLRIMRYRSEIIGAHLEIKSNKDHGIVIQCRMPLPA